MYDLFARTFPVVRGPWAIALRDAGIARATYDMYDRLCPRTQLGQAQLELMILVVARRYTAQYIWFVHENLGRTVGLPQSLIDAIRANRLPAFENDDQRFVYDVTTELLASWSLGDAAYAVARERLGEERLVELVTAVGFYAMLALQLNAFAVAIPAGVKPLDPA